MPIVWGLLVPRLRGAGLSEPYTQTICYAASLVLCLLLTYLVFGELSFPADAVSIPHPLRTYGWLGFVGAAGAFVSSFQTPDQTPTAGVVIGYVLFSLTVAVCEEEMFRRIFFGILTHEGDRFRKDRVVYAAVIVCVLFGLRHLANLLFHSGQVVTCSFQVLSTAMAGVYLLGLYLVCHSLIPVIVIHFLEDFAVTAIEMFSTSAAADASEDLTPLQGFLMAAIQIPYLICGVIMIRRYVAEDHP